MLEVISLTKTTKASLLKKLDELILALGFDYDRMSESGQETYNEICRCMEQLIGG
jgi:hypothetical protein